jgi:hypothetical protein
MSANPEAMWSNSAALTVEDPADDSEILLAGVREYSVTPAYEHTNLYTIDSTFREEVKRYEHDVNVEITYAKFSLEFAQEWLGGEGSTATASQDSADPMLFNLVDVTPSSDGTFERTTEVADVVFPELPLDQVTYGEFEEYSITGTGRQVSQLEDTSGA